LDAHRGGLATRNGPGYSIRLEALPVDGRIVLVESSGETKAAAQQA